MVTRFDEDVLALVKVNSNRTLQFSVFDDLFPNLGLGPSRFERVAEEAEDLYAQIFPRDLAREYAVKDLGRTSVRPDSATVIELLSKPLNFPGLALAGFPDDREAPERAGLAGFRLGIVIGGTPSHDVEQFLAPRERKVS